MPQLASVRKFPQAASTDTISFQYYWSKIFVRSRHAFVSAKHQPKIFARICCGCASVIMTGNFRASHLHPFTHCVVEITSFWFHRGQPEICRASIFLVNIEGQTVAVSNNKLGSHMRFARHDIHSNRHTRSDADDYKRVKCQYHVPSFIFSSELSYYGFSEKTRE